MLDMCQEKSFIISYDKGKYDFRSIVHKMLDMFDLTKLHLNKQYQVFDRKHDQLTHWHRLYYDQFEKFGPLYKMLLSEYIMPFFRIPSGGLVYQQIPTFRVHLVGNVAVGEWHRDRAYNHDDSEINFWLPFTNSYDTNTVWIESGEGKDDFEPYAVEYGQILIFRGVGLTHGNKINQTSGTRVSVDFRLSELKNFQSSGKTSINMGTPFNIGGYFSVL